MKRTLSIIAFVAICSALMVSCRDNKKSQKPSQEEIQNQKQALADTVLAKIDEIAQQYWDVYSNSFRIRTMVLTDAEKVVRPDYLLDPSVANTLVTKTQKINALAIYEIEQAIRKIYDMPCEDVEDVIAKLIVETNCPLSNEDLLSDMPVTEKIKAYYNTCKERGDLALFWQYEEAIGTEISYLLVMNPELYFGKMTEEQWKNYYNTRHYCMAGIRCLAEYDEEIATLRDFVYQDWTIADIDEAARINSNIASAREYRVAHKDMYIAKRNALLQ